MAEKAVAVSTVTHQLSREENGVVFTVANDSSHFGELVVSKGGVRWKPRGKQDHHFLSWSQLDKKMREAPKR